MDRRSQTKDLVLVFSTIIKRLVLPTFVFPNPSVGTTKRAINSCIEALEKEHLSVSKERIVDYCICQAYAASFYEDFHKVWTPSHSFGKKALSRFANTSKGTRYYEDKWLSESGLSRGALLRMIADRSTHPQAKYIYPEYEDSTKRRLVGTDAGYYNCGDATLLWTPFSPVCQSCSKSTPCKARTQKLYPELYRLRTQAYEEDKERT